MTIGAIMLHIMLFNNVSAPIRQAHRIYDDMNDAAIYAEGYFDILNADNETEQNGTFIEKRNQRNFRIKKCGLHLSEWYKSLA